MSRNLVENELGYEPSSFYKLTDDEARIDTTGPIGAILPEGAIYLTWYHKSSTRIFRNMRFLVSRNMQYDMIIGAHSIQRENLLDVPNLLARKTVDES